MSSIKKSGKQRWKPSYLRRQGNITPAQKKALRNLWGDYGLTFGYQQVLNLPLAFGRQAPCALEIGFGRGEHLLPLAKHNPKWNIVGVEVHRPAIGTVLRQLHEQQITNVRIIRGDALLVLCDHLKEPIFHRVCVLFPDPWPQEKDKGRRLVNPLLIQRLSHLGVAGCALQVVTDVADYAEHTDQVMQGFPTWKANHKAFFARKEVTKYEQKAIREGREIFELRYDLVSVGDMK